MKRLAVVAVAIGCGAGGATSGGDTARLEAELAKLNTRHEVLLSIVNVQESTKSNWWCGPFLCDRTEAMCNAIEERTSKTPEKCLPRRRAFCRAVGKPPMRAGADPGWTDTMTCHFSLKNCESMVEKIGAGAPCLGVE